jgi:molecular chaperone GrpE
MQEPPHHSNSEAQEGDANQPDTSEIHSDAADENTATMDAEKTIHALMQEKDQQIANLKDQHLRALAEIENLRRRAERDKSDTAKYAITGFARDLTQVLENLKRAADCVPEEARDENQMLATIVTGVEMTLTSLLQAFEKNGITRIDPMGEAFDHNQHQSISQMPATNGEAAGTIMQVVQAGYKIHDRLLTPAMVVVAAANKAENADTSPDADGDDSETGSHIDTRA